jgi:hypothetical protein
MPERPRPDMDRTREALRRHDERTGDDPAEDAPEEEPAAAEEDEEEEPGRAP